MGGLNRKLFSWLISQPPPARRRTTLDELGKERTKTGRDCLLCLSLVSISSTRIVLQLLLFVEHFYVQLSKSLACPTHFNSITVTSSVLISCFTSLQKQRNRKRRVIRWQKMSHSESLPSSQQGETDGRATLR